MAQTNSVTGARGCGEKTFSGMRLASGAGDGREEIDMDMEGREEIGVLWLKNV